MAYPADATAPSRESAEMARMRQEAKGRRRRLIYNNDGNDLRPGKLSTPAEFLQQRIEPALGTQVDSIFYCSHVTTMYAHDTDVAERFDDHADAIQAAGKPVNPEIGKFRDNMRMLRAAGKDCLEVVVERCHEAGVEVFWTHRMNDIHDSFETDWLFSDWKRDHPEYLMGTPDDMKRYKITHPRYMWSTLDFDNPEVLDYLYRIIEEVCRRYDVDGIELDYFRHPLFFRPNLEYKSATPAQVEIMTGFQRRIREMAYREGSRRGRPILGSGYQPLSMPSGDLVELGHAHDVPVYPNISASGMQQWGGRIEAWRAAASNVWQARADGINLFNWFPGALNDSIFMTLGDPQTIAGLDKVFGIDNVKEDFGCLEQGVVQSQILPVKLDSAGKPRQVNLPIGDDIAAAADDLKGASLRVQFVSRAPDDKVELVLNGEKVAPEGEISEDGWVTYRPELGLYRLGDNMLSFRVTGGAPAREKEISVQSVELHVDYR